MGEVFSWCEREQWEKFSPRFMICPIFFSRGTEKLIKENVNYGGGGVKIHHGKTLFFTGTENHGKT